MSQEQIQLDILINVQGLPELSAIKTAMNNVYTAANGVTSAQDAQVNRQGRVSAALGAWGQKLTNVERSYDAIFRAGMHMTMLGSQLTSFFQQGVRLANGAVTAYSSLQTQLTFTANAIGGITEGTPMWNALRNAVQQAAIQLAEFKPEEVAQGLYFWEGATGQTIKSQKDLKAAMEGLNPLLKLSYMRHIDMKQAVYGVEGAMRMFGLSISETGNVAAEFNSIVNKNGLEMSDLIGAMSQVGPVAKQYKMSIYDTANAIAALADNGIRGSRAGMVLRMELMKIGDPTKAASKALNSLMEHTKGLGKSYMDLVFPNGKFVGFTNYINLMAKATVGLNDKQKAVLFGTIGTAREVSGLIATIDTAQKAMSGAMTTGGAVLTPLQQSVQDFNTGWKNVSTTWDFLTKQFRNAIEPILYAIGEDIVKTAGPLLAMASGWVAKLDEWINKNPEIVAMIEKFAAIAVIVAGVAGAFFTVMGSVTLLIAGIGVVIQAFAPFLLVLGLIGAAVAFIVYAFVNNIGGMQGAVKNLKTALIDFFSALTGSSGTFKLSWGSIGTMLDKAVKEWGPKVAKAINMVASAIEALSKNKTAMQFIRDLGKAFIGLLVIEKVSGLINKVISPINNLAKGINGTVKALHDMNAALGHVNTGLTKMMSSTNKLIGYLKQFAVTILGYVADALGVIGTVVAAIAEVLGLPEEVVALVIAAVIALIVGIIAYLTNFMGFRDKVNAFVGQVAALLGQVVANLAAFIGQVWNNLVAIGGQVIAQVFNIFGQIVAFVVNALSTLLNNIGYYLGYGLGLLIGFAAKGLLIFLGWVGDVGRNVIGFFTSLPGKIIGGVGSLLGKFVAWVTTTFIPGIGPALTGLISNIVQFFIDLPGKVINGVQKLISRLQDFFANIPAAININLLGIGEAIVNGIWNGILGMIDWFKKQVGGFFSGIVNGIKDALGIKSPSRVFAEIGTNMVAGMAVGISGSDAAAKALQNHTNQLLGIAKQGVSSINSTLYGPQSGSYAFSMSQDRTLHVQIDVSSKDGSVSKLQTTDLANALQGSDMVRALAHMASVN